MLRTAVVGLVGLTRFIMKAHGHSAVFMLTTMCQLESAGNVFSVTTSCDECNIAQVTGSYILW